MIALGLALGLAWAHDPAACPPMAGLQDHVRRGPVPPALQRCLVGDDPLSRQVQLWDRLRREGPNPKWEADYQAWLAASPGVDLALDLAEALAPTAPALARPALDVAAAGLAAEGWSTHRVGLAARWTALAGPLGLPAEALPPPGPGELSACADLGRIQAQVALGAVYGQERDCVVRLVERLSGEARVQAAELAWALTLRARDRSAGPAVQARLTELVPDHSWPTPAAGW